MDIWFLWYLKVLQNILAISIKFINFKIISSNIGGNMSKIIFLGTAGDSFVLAKQIRASGGIIIQSGDVQIHIDPGPGALVRAVENNINLRENTAILLSNNLLINSNDLNAVIDAMTYGGMDKKGVLVANPSIINGTDEEKPVITKFHQKCLERIIVLNKGQKLGIEDIEIFATPASNKDKTAIGFRIILPDMTLGYTSNTRYSKEVKEAYEGCDVLILSVIAPAGEKEENQLNSEDAEKIIKHVNPKLAIIHQFGIKMIRSDPLYEGRELQKKTGIQVLTAKDGMTLTPGFYAAKTDQKRLNKFKEKEKKEDNKININAPSKKQEEEKPDHEHQEHLDFLNK